MALNEDHGLTPEEAAALEFNDEEEGAPIVDPEAEPEAAAEPAADDAKAQADPDAADGGEPAAAAAEPAAAADPAPEAQPEPAPAKAEAVAPAPVLIAQAPEDAQAKLDKIATDKADLLEKFEAGEITTREYQTGLDALNTEQSDIKAQLREAELAQRLNAQQIQNAWVADCNRFIGAHAEYKDEALLGQLDMAIKLIASQPANRGLDNVAALEKAHAMVMAMNGKTAAPAPEAKPAKPVQPKVPTPAAPPNIGNLPAAAMNDTTGGEFAAIEALRKSGDVDKYEAAVASLSEAARDRYFKA